VSESFLTNPSSSSPPPQKKIPKFCGTLRFITAFTRAHHLSLSWARLIHSVTPVYFLNIHLDVIHPFMPGCSKLSLSLKVSPPKTLYAPLLSSIRATRPAYLILLDLITPIFCEELSQATGRKIAQTFRLITDVYSENVPGIHGSNISDKLHCSP
jgi:hypothetical protein